MSMKNPVHPGRVVRDCIKASDNMSVVDAAKLLGVSRGAVSNLVNEKASISPEMAIRLEKVGWGSADSWMRMQMNYDLAQVRARQDEITVPAPGVPG